MSNEYDCLENEWLSGSVVAHLENGPVKSKIISELDGVAQWLIKKKERGEKKIPLEPGWRWLSNKQKDRYKEQLIDLAIILNAIYPDQEIKNPYTNLEQQLLSSLQDLDNDYLMLYRQLLEGITKLNHMYRIRSEGKWLVHKEDMMTVLRLLQPEIRPSSLMGRGSKLLYRKLQLEFYPRDFKVLDVTKKLRMSKSTTKRYIRILEKCGYIERVGGDKNQGYIYNFGERS